jgi:DNA helicase-2/ATP-dependent DNA helicase PcrA
LIRRNWYYDYAKENELDIGKTDILYSLAVREETIIGFLQRLNQLPKLIENYKCTDNNPIILSTIHSAKGLEFDTVYIIDVYDGSLPHSSRDDAREQECIDTYEEERRVFYVAVTRAKNELYLLYITDYGSEFINEIMPSTKEAKDIAKFNSNVNKMQPQINTFPVLTDSTLAAFTVSARVRHKTCGEGIIIGFEKKRNDIHVIEVKFDSGTKIKFHLEVVIRMELLKLV